MRSALNIRHSWKVVDKFSDVWGNRNTLRRARDLRDFLNAEGQSACRPFSIIERIVEEKEVT